jgi:hypothetical protein
MFRVGAMWFIGAEQCFDAALRKLDSVGLEKLDAVVSREEFSELINGYSGLLDYFGATIVTKIGPARLPVTTRFIGDLEFLYRSGTLKWREARDLIRTIKSCYEAELKSMVWFGLSEGAPYFEEPTKGWDDVIERFGCGDDVEEASKCFAMARYTASVFHLMRVVERGVLEMEVFLNRAPDPKAHFGSVISKLEDLVQKNKFDQVPAHLRSYLSFMREVLPQVHAVKDAWRDKVSHVDNKIVPVGTFSEEKALEVYSATRSLMKKLSSGLPPKN